VTFSLHLGTEESSLAHFKHSSARQTLDHNDENQEIDQALGQSGRPVKNSQFAEHHGLRNRWS
jgi:hypothetical protein